MSDFEIIIDWFKGLRKKLKWLELLLFVNIAGIFGLSLSLERGEHFGVVVTMIVLAISVFSIKELYRWWTTKRAFQAIDNIREIIAKSSYEKDGG